MADSLTFGKTSPGSKRVSEARTELLPLASVEAGWRLPEGDCFRRTLAVDLAFGHFVAIDQIVVRYKPDR
jgi:hypothetical protein